MSESSVEALFSQIEAEGFTLNFIIYLARILLNFDEGASRWWTDTVEPSVPIEASEKERALILRRRFADFAASVEFSLRRFQDQKPETKDRFFAKLVDDYGKDQEGQRHLALAFSLLDEQPQRLIGELMSAGDTRQRLTAAFSPGLTDYLAMNPRRLLPLTQYPVWDGGRRRWMVRGLGDARPLVFGSREEAAADTIFGPRSSSVVSQERELGLKDFALFAVSGAAGCSFTHSLVIPLDVVKTRMQTEPGRWTGGLIQGGKQILQAEGWQALTRGWEPTLLGYMYYGITVYPGYEFFKRLYLAIAGPILAASFKVPLVLLAGASATVIACAGVCPAEAVRIRMVADGALGSKGLFPVVNAIAAEGGGIGAFYDGLGTILIRQVLFGMMKFLVFDFFGDFLFDLFPVLTESIESQLAVSLVSGAVAGVVSSVVSQPADTVLSKLNQGAGRKSFLEAAQEILQEYGPQGFFLGLGSRCIWAGCIISGQFFLYDLCKSLLGMRDLRIFLDVQI